jgi:type II secretory pathway pseudopilin PulG
MVVVAIIAVISIVLVLTLNPAELTRRARDSNRIADLSTIRSAIALYLLADVSPPVILGGAGYRCYIDGASTGTCQSWFPTTNFANSTTTTSTRKIDGTGWIPIKFTDITSGSPIGALPVDPVNDSSFFYSYVATTTNFTFKLAAQMESNKYSYPLGGETDVESNDGGVSSSTYEVGTNMNL